MCGVVGIYNRGGEVCSGLYEALTLLQHRGQDAAGIMTYDEATQRLHRDKGPGLVRDVFGHLGFKDKKPLAGHFGIGHVRYPTSGIGHLDETQPFYVNSPCGIALAHNGNLINARDLRSELANVNRRHVNTNSDSEILLNVFAHELAQDDTSEMSAQRAFAAVERLFSRCHGSYTAVALIIGVGLLAFRDPNGIRPLVIGMRESNEGKEYMIASESVAVDSLGYDDLRDVAPGEIVLIAMDGTLHTHQVGVKKPPHICAFEYVYFARPDSIIDNVFVHKARMRMGEMLAQKIKKQGGDDIDTVIPVPDTSRTAALELAICLGAKYREGFIKNRYVGRTFIMPEQDERWRSVQRKLHPLDIEFKDKNILIVDDSIVRGTTSKQIVQMARESMAKKVYFASAAPPIMYPNIYGIDMPVTEELVAYNRSEEEVCRFIGADRLFYQDLPDLIQSIKAGNPELEDLESSVFDGQYIHDLPDDYFDYLRERRRKSGQ